MGNPMVTLPMTSRDPQKFKILTPICLEPHISKTAEDGDFVSKNQQQEMAYGESNGRMTDDVSWP